jgi:hypothetical protein
MRYHLTSVMAIIRKLKDYCCFLGCVEKETHIHCLWECKLV